MKLALFTVSFAGFWGQEKLTLEEAIDKTAALGYQGIEIMGKRPHLSPLDYSVDDCKRLREHIEVKDLSVAAVAAYTNFTEGIAGEVPSVECQIGYVEALAERASLLGSDLVRVFTSYERDDMPLNVQWRQTVDAVRESAERAASYGVTVGVQNHHDLGADTRMLLELLEEVDHPNVIPMYDCWSPYLRGENVSGNARDLASRMQFTTVADYLTLPRYRFRAGAVNYSPVEPPLAIAVPMGEGDLPYEAFFEALLEGGFDGWVSYEMCSPIRAGGSLASLEQYARQFIEYMKKYIAVGIR